MLGGGCFPFVALFMLSKRKQIYFPSILSIHFFPTFPVAWVGWAYKFREIVDITIPFSHLL